MKKTILIYGFIAGFIVGALMLATMPLWNSGVLNFDNGALVGYTTMVIALSVIFFGVKSYRDNHSGGAITFWKAVQIGMLITTIASVMYALSWEVSYDMIIADDFMQKMTDHYVAKMKAKGASAEEMKSMESYFEWYKNPVIRFGMTLMEILPVGIVITLLSAGLLRRKEFLPIETRA